MRAVRVVRLEGPAAVEVHDLDEPTSDRDVVVEVHHAGVTFPDVLLTRGTYQIKPDLPFVPGSEVAGIVRAAPDGSGLRPGDRVAAFLGVGAFAEVVATAPETVFRLPDGVPFEVAAALPMNYFTAHFALTRRGRLQPGATVLVHGAAGGVGTASIQVAKALGATVVAVASSDDKREVARQAGADHVLPVDGFRDAVRELTDGRGVDVIVDPVGSDRFLDSLRSLAVEGRHLVIGFTGGEIPTVKVNRLLLNNIEVVGVGWGAFFLRDLPYLQEQWADLRGWLEDGLLDPPVGAIYPLEAAAEAIADLEERRAVGKVLLALR